MEVTLFALLLAALAYGLQRNHARQSQPLPPLAGSTDVQDRDIERVVHDLHAHAEFQPTFQSVQAPACPTMTG